MRNLYKLKQKNGINFLLLFLCILLLGFVYINSFVIDKFYLEKNKATANDKVYIEEIERK